MNVGSFSSYSPVSIVPVYHIVIAVRIHGIRRRHDGWIRKPRVPLLNTWYVIVLFHHTNKQSLINTMEHQQEMSYTLAASPG